MTRNCWSYQKTKNDAIACSCATMTMNVCVDDGGGGDDDHHHVRMTGCPRRRIEIFVGVDHGNSSDDGQKDAVAVAAGSAYP